MLTEHDAVPGTEYYGDDHFGEPVGKEALPPWRHYDYCRKWVGEDCTCGGISDEKAREGLEEFDMFLKEQILDFEDMQQYTSFDAYQDFTDSTAIYPEDKGLEYTALGLASEAGEFAGKVKKWIRDGKKDDEALVAELGDVLWYVARAAAELQVHLSDVAKDNVEKLKSRKERNVIKGDGDDR